MQKIKERIRQRIKEIQKEIKEAHKTCSESKYYLYEYKLRKVALLNFYKFLNCLPYFELKDVYSVLNSYQDEYRANWKFVGDMPVKKPYIENDIDLKIWEEEILIEIMKLKRFINGEQQEEQTKLEFVSGTEAAYTTRKGGHQTNKGN
ncbi:hypothetical protein GWK08_08930 [Leptobacterium flavescens]|uniref:Uncharacterized protein n=1 Tax=Leptobacterium flavescens TaxID=472055 RepID=A0A6P0UNS3_9FLAO|nr:hypothetical protein [Leptobacterium flavescens]NER13558.1 hypothetical protein [Leptobacterium flavescens]